MYIQCPKGMFRKNIRKKCDLHILFLWTSNQNLTIISCLMTLNAQRKDIWIQQIHHREDAPFELINPMSVNVIQLGGHTWRGNKIIKWMIYTYVSYVSLHYLSLFYSDRRISLFYHHFFYGFISFKSPWHLRIYSLVSTQNSMHDKLDHGTFHSTG